MAAATYIQALLVLVVTLSLAEAMLYLARGGDVHGESGGGRTAGSAGIAVVDAT